MIENWESYIICNKGFCLDEMICVNKEIDKFEREEGLC